MHTVHQAVLSRGNELDSKNGGGGAADVAPGSKKDCATHMQHHTVPAVDVSL